MSEHRSLAGKLFDGQGGGNCAHAMQGKSKKPDNRKTELLINRAGSITEILRNKIKDNTWSSAIARCPLFLEKFPYSRGKCFSKNDCKLTISMVSPSG